ncbi:MAG: DegT/DnrJ/EryC1/StrS family aminotransferase [Bacillota bacterium]
MEKRIFLSSPHMSDEGYEMAYIKEAFDTNWIAPLGENVNKFEEEMASYLGAEHAVALASGSSAIHLGLKYLGVGDGDVVFCSSLTFSGSCNAIKYLNATPVFIDCDYETYNISKSALEKAYVKYPNPKAIIIVDLYGNPANYDEILPIIKQHGTPIMEDAAEALGATYKGAYCGTFGDIGILSFNGNKIITTSGGGMAIVNNIETKQKLTFWATQSRENFPWYQHEEVGYNYRLSNICAGIGRGQMKVLDKRVARKREIFELYKEGFANCDQITMSPETVDSLSNRWLTVITLSETCKTDFMTIINKLSENNIEARPLWKPMHLQPVFADCDFFSSIDEGTSQINPEKPMSISETLFARSLCLPSDSKMTDEEVKAVVEIVLECVR